MNLNTNINFKRTEAQAKLKESLQISYLSESRNWRIFRAGQMNEFGGMDYNKGMFGVEHKGEFYGWFKTLKSAKQYVNNWITINPQDN